MNRIASTWTHLTRRRRAALYGSAGVVVFGVLLIAVGEIQHWGWTRLVGAGLISAAATLFGVLLGWSDASWMSFRAALRRSARWVVLGLAVIVLLPVLLGLALSFAGLIAGGQENGAGVLIAGALVMLFLLIVTGALGFEALRLALRVAAGEHSPDDGARANGKNGS